MVDVTSKAAIIKDNKEFYAKEQGMVGASLQDIILHEINTNVHILNGENNSKKLDKSKKTSWEYKYTSTSRTVLRNLWLMDFVFHLMKNLHDDKSTSLGHCAKDAYGKGLGPHHPWVVRQAAKVAMLACPARETFMTNTGGTYEDLLFVKESVEKVKGVMWAFYETKGLSKLD